MAMEVCLPQAKLAELKQLIQHWCERKVCTIRELESLVGKLAHAAQVVQPSKTFLRRMFETKAARGRSKGMVRLNLGFRSNVAWCFAAGLAPATNRTTSQVQDDTWNFVGNLTCINHFQ